VRGSWNFPLSSIVGGRSVATVAELCFAGQCALLIGKLSALAGNASLHVVSWTIVALILLAQVCCWYAVISLNHLGHAIEEILWSVLACLAAVSRPSDARHRRAHVRRALATWEPRRSAMRHGSYTVT